MLIFFLIKIFVVSHFLRPLEILLKNKICIGMVVYTWGWGGVGSECLGYTGRPVPTQTKNKMETLYFNDVYSLLQMLVKKSDLIN